MFGDALYEQVPRLWEAMSVPLAGVGADGAAAPPPPKQAVVDACQLLRRVGARVAAASGGTCVAAASSGGTRVVAVSGGAVFGRGFQLRGDHFQGKRQVGFVGFVHEFAYLLRHVLQLETHGI